jgi:hypothetical protein
VWVWLSARAQSLLTMRRVTATLLTRIAENLLRHNYIATFYCWKFLMLELHC